MDKYQFRYSFVIPHRDNPELLRRCIGSIPERDDIQVIVVDDNSRDIESVQGVVAERQGTQLFSTNGVQKGAGHARNMGIAAAKGEWLLFADCDDYYVNGFLDTLDYYKDYGGDVVYFNYKGINTDGTVNPRYNKLSELYENFDGSYEMLNKIKYRITMPWNKMIRRTFIKEYHIQFEDVKKGNDVRFSYEVAFFSRRVAVEKSKLYCWIFNKSSITNRKIGGKDAKEMLQQHYKQKYFTNNLGLNSNHGIIYRLLSLLIHNGIGSSFMYFTAYISFRKIARSEQDTYIKRIMKEIISLR